MPDAADPFTQAYSAVWIALTSWHGFTDLVRPGNRNDLSKKTFTMPKPGAMAGDLPEVSLLQGKFLLTPFGSNSRVSEAMQILPLVTVTDWLNVLDLNGVKWAVHVALMKHADAILNAKWGGTTFIRDFDITDGSDGTGGIALLNTDALRGASRWANILQIRLSLYFDRTAVAGLA